MGDFISHLQKYSAVCNYSGTDKITSHSYGDVYNRIFEKLRRRDEAGEVLHVLENGIFSGAFLQVMSEYLPNAMVYGVDITLSRVKYGNDNKRIQMWEMDGTLPETAAHLGRMYDLIIEDGSHLPEHQIASLDTFAPYLKTGGTYVIEDIDGRYEMFLQNEFNRLAVKHKLTMEWIDLRSKKGRFDDIIAVFYKH